MSRLMRHEVISKILEIGLIPTFYEEDEKQVFKVNIKP